MVVAEDERSVSVMRSSLSLSLRPKQSPHPPNLHRKMPLRLGLVRERSSFGADSGVSSGEVGFSAREVISAFDWSLAVNVAVGEYDAKRTRGDPA